jgi:hypothetical protein
MTRSLVSLPFSNHDFPNLARSTSASPISILIPPHPEPIVLYDNWVNQSIQSSSHSVSANEPKIFCLYGQRRPVGVWFIFNSEPQPSISKHQTVLPSVLSTICVQNYGTAMLEVRATSDAKQIDQWNATHELSYKLASKVLSKSSSASHMLPPLFPNKQCFFDHDRMEMACEAFGHKTGLLTGPVTECFRHWKPIVPETMLLTPAQWVKRAPGYFNKEWLFTVSDTISLVQHPCLIAIHCLPFVDAPFGHMKLPVTIGLQSCQFYALQ